MRHLLQIIALAVAGLGTGVDVAEGQFKPSHSLDIERHIGMSLSDAKKMVTSLRERQRRVIDIEVRPAIECTQTNQAVDDEACDTTPRFDLVSEPNPEDQRWLVTLAQSEATYAASWKEHSEAGMRLVDLEPHSVYTFTRGGPAPKRVQFSALWIESRQKLGWVSFSRLSSAAFSEKFKTHGEAQEMAVTSYATYELLGSDCPKPPGSRLPTCIAAVFTQPPTGERWAFFRNLTPDAYIEKKLAYEKAGFRTLMLNNQSGRIAVTFMAQPDAANWQSFARMSESEYKRTAATMRDKGYRLVDFEAGSLEPPNSQDISFGSIWFKPPAPPARAPASRP